MPATLHRRHAPASIRSAVLVLAVVAFSASAQEAPRLGTRGVSAMSRGPMTLHAPPQGMDGRTVGLFDGQFFSEWVDRDGAPSTWVVTPEQSVRAGGGDAVSKRSFGDFQLHIEFMCPRVEGATGQARSNSGVYLHGRYEIQVLESYAQPPAHDRCGGIYGQHDPIVNASAPAGIWQTYDIVFRAPRFAEDGSVSERPRMTVLHNGIVIHNNVELAGPTAGGLGEDMVREGPILLQDHGDPVEYRNIWARPL